LKPNGCIVIDDGAFTAVSSKHAASLFAVGITSVEGNFSDQEVVSVKHNCEIVGQGIVNYSSEDMKKIVGIKGDKISEVLGFDDYDCVIHRDNLVISKRKASTD
jgi:glutamate 5-kinase